MRDASIQSLPTKDHDRLRSRGAAPCRALAAIATAAIILAAVTACSDFCNFGLGLRDGEYVYEITFHPGVGTTGEAPFGSLKIEIYEGDIEDIGPLSISECDLVKPGYVLRAWNTRKSFKGDFVPLLGLVDFLRADEEGIYFRDGADSEDYEDFLDLHAVWVPEGSDFFVVPLGNGEGKVELYLGDDEDVVIPDTLEGLAITAIGGGFASLLDAKVKTIHVPEGVRSIEAYAFKTDYGDKRLTRIDLPESLTTIGAYAFWECQGLTAVDLPEGLREIGEHAFKGCNAITDMRLPSSLTSIGEWAFSDCAAWSTPVTIPPSITKLAAGLFYACSSMASLDLPDTLVEIDDYCLYGCKSLEELELPASLRRVGLVALSYCGFQAFTLPGGVEFDGGVLIGCARLETVDLSGYPEPPENVLSCCRALTSVTLSDRTEELPPSAFCSCSALASIELPSGLKTIRLWALGETALAEISFPASLERIDWRAFYQCADLALATFASANCEICDAGVFEGAAAGFTIRAPSGGTVEAFCESNGIAFEALE